MDMNLTGKRAVVCGASKGIGRVAAQEIALLGANVTLVARNEDALKTALKSLDASKGQKHHVLVADFNDPAELKNKIEADIKAHGTAHILVNNTGGPPAGTAQDATLEQFEKTFAQHLLCNHVLMQAVLPGMQVAKYGRIINVISTSVKAPIKGLGVSNTIRAAVANWSKTLSMEVAVFGITVNNVLPGATDTDRLSEIFDGRAQKSGKSKDEVIAEEKSHIPAGRFARPEELGAAIAFLASPAASYINGINLPVDGGRTGSL
jgi:3-oxoacyl-[acyl-carrier protein] reductase